MGIYKLNGEDKMDNKKLADLLFNDSAEISDYAKEAVANLYSLKIINGMGDNMFCPKLSVTRAQAAQVVYNVITEG